MALRRGALRVTSDLWVSALVRRIFGSGGYAAVVRRGATEAGAIFVTVRDRLGEVCLYGPAPQAAYDTDSPDERFFALMARGSDQVVDDRIQRELRFDTDIWVVDVEASGLSDLIRIVEP